MKKEVRTLLFVGALAIATILVVAHNAGANSGYRNAYDAAHGNPAGTTVCTFCHTSPPTLNATGQTLFASENPPGSTNFNYCSIGPATGTCVPTVTAPVISTFTATPASITSGSSSTLAWTLSGGAPTTLSIDNSVGSVLGTTSRAVSPTATTTYTLTASNSAGSVTRTVTVTVTATVSAPVISSLTATPASITSGSSSTLAWTLSGGAPTTLSIDNSVGSVLGTTSRAVSPTATTTYTLTASNSAGSVTRTVTVTVTATVSAPVISSLTATPASITSGSSSTLAWTLSGGAPTTLSIDNSVGSVLGTTSRAISPTATTTYTLTASNSAGSVTRTVTVTVTPPDGVALYASNCAGCHGPLASSAKRGRSATQIQSAINSNRGGMGSLSSLTSAQVQTIADALGQQAPAPVLTSVTVTPPTASIAPQKTLQLTASPLDQNRAAFVGTTITWSSNSPVATINAATGLVTGVSVGTATITATATSGATTKTGTSVITVTQQAPPPPAIDGAALYTQNCATCHGPLASSTKRGRTSAQIRSAINNPAYPMSGLSVLTTAQIDAIAAALAQQPPPPPLPPTTDGPTLYAQNCAVCHGILVASTKRGRSATQIQNAIDADRGGMGSLNYLTSAQIQAIAAALAQQTPSPTTDGPSLYAQNCASCHAPIATSAKLGRTAAQIQNAINTVPAMSGLGFLTSAQIQAIAAALAQQTPSPTTDGPSLYAQNCASCHAPIATSAKLGRTAAQIQNAINTVPAMSGLGFLTSAQIQAIATALGSQTPDTTPPTVTAFSIPATSNSLTVTITTLTATDNVGVTGYMVTESATAPGASAAGWTTTAPASYTCATAGAKTLYAWAKDASGNVSASKSGTVTVTAQNPSPSPSPAIDLTAWSGQWLKMKIKYTGFSFGNSNSGRDSADPISSEDANTSGMSKDQQNIAVYLKLVSWDANQGVLQGELYQFDSQSNQWVSDPLAFHLIGGTPTDFLCWTQVNGDFTSGFVVRIQGRERGSALTGGTFKTLGGYYFELNKGVSLSAPGSLAGAISISGSLVPESKVPVPK